MPAPSASYPALYLYPLNDSFVPKHISLLHNQRVKIGRQTNAKTQPGEKNGYFDSKVLSRQHAEVWEEGNKIFIKDVKSSNGTFINGERLSPEGLESDPYELKSDDIVEFGIDIVGEDNKTIVHHKVAARVVCVFNEQDVQMAARAEMHQLQHSLQQQQQFLASPSQVPSSAMGPGSSVSTLLPNPSGAGPTASAFNFTGGNNSQQQRRPQSTGHQNMVGMGGMGGSMRPPGKSGLTFDHILSRLQGELQKSRETGAELHTLSGAIHEIHDTLGGGLPSNVPPYPHTLPPVRSSQAISGSPPPSDHDGANHLSGSESSSSSNMLSDLHSQLQDTQASLSLHVEKIKTLETALKEQEAVREDVRMLRDMMESMKRGGVFLKENGTAEHGSKDPSRRDHSGGVAIGFDMEDEELLAGSDEDDAMSVGTVVPHELERVQEEDEELLPQDNGNNVHLNGILEEKMDMMDADEDSGDLHDVDQDRDDEERRRRREELGRPRTPEPTNLGLGLDSRTRNLNLRSRHSQYSRQQELHGNTMSMIDDLQGRLSALSSQLESALELSSTLQSQHASAQAIISTLEVKVETLENLVKASIKSQSSPRDLAPSPSSGTDQAESETITQKIMEWKKNVEGQWSNVQEEWTQERERLSRAREEWENKVRQMDSGIDRLEKMQRRVMIGDASPWTGNGDAVRHLGGLATPPSPRSLSSDSDRPRRRRSGSRGRSNSKKKAIKTETVITGDGALKGNLMVLNNLSPDKDGSKSLATPEASVRTLPSTFSIPNSPILADDPSKLDAKLPKELQHNHLNMQTALGVLVLSMAAAAVVWRIKPE